MKKAWRFFLIFFSALKAQEFIDLEENLSDFVVETKQIVIPEFPGAFNASIIRLNNKILMCFRVRDEKLISTFDIGFVWLDDNFNLMSQPQLLEIYGMEDVPFITKNQDPRLIFINKKLFIIFSSLKKVDDISTRRMFVGQVQYKNDRFFVNNPVCLSSFAATQRWEKNWVPFNFNENLLLAYSIAPHHILKPDLQTGQCETIHVTTAEMPWEWGQLRGGTPALLDGNEYIAFFHSSKNMKTMHSQGKEMQHYFMGAYTFSAQPPFHLTRISPAPIVGKDFYHGSEYPTWKPLRVVFAMGLLVDRDYFWVSYGRQDFEIWVAKIDKKKLYKSLIPCSVNIIAAPPKETPQFELLFFLKNMVQNQVGNLKNSLHHFYYLIYHVFYRDE